VPTTWIVAADAGRGATVRKPPRKETAKRLAWEIDKDLSWFDVWKLEKYVVPGKARKR
jgi:hypothetical protein